MVLDFGTWWSRFSERCATLPVEPSGTVRVVVAPSLHAGSFSASPNVYTRCLDATCQSETPTSTAFAGLRDPRTIACTPFATQRPAVRFSGAHLARSSTIGAYGSTWPMFHRRAPGSSLITTIVTCMWHATRPVAPPRLLNASPGSGMGALHRSTIRSHPDHPRCCQVAPPC
jgi:hypothetical protein